ncbi:MAG: LEA type 2 family protein [Deltaproteobacteria bacterium]|nr:MAG: LEA type 2 family protein [Deltaproteobacteria bacterium]TMQ27418.1 MAG: LEA type 2 family protein [Deltaproteobacteria bacterium]
MHRSSASLLTSRARAIGVSVGLAVGALLCVTGCRSAPSPELHVLGVHGAPRRDVVFVQVTNPAGRAMRLTRLEYTFAAAGETVSEGEVALARDIPAGAAVVLEIPLDSPSEKPMTLSGRLTAELDQIVHIFSVSAQIAPRDQGK